MEDIGLFNQGWKWVETESSCCCSVKVASGLLRKAEVLVKRHWPNVCYGCGRLGVVFWLLIVHWKDCVLRGFKSFFGLGTVALLVIIWSCFLSLTSMSCLLYVLLSMGAAGCAVHYLDRTTGELLQEYKGHTCKSFKMDCCLTNSDAHVIGGSEDGYLFIWDLVDASVVSKFRAHSSVVRDEIEQLMDEDGDMDEMYLTEKKIRTESLFNGGDQSLAGCRSPDGIQSVSAPISSVCSPPSNGRRFNRNLSLASIGIKAS